MKINEKGTVIFACGAFHKVFKSLIDALEEAAYKAKFNATTLN